MQRPCQSISMTNIEFFISNIMQDILIRQRLYALEAYIPIKNSYASPNASI